METAALVLAAGAGTRMKSKKPKVAHEILGKPLVRWVVDAAHEAGVTKVVSVVGHARDYVIPLVENDTAVVVQQQQRGTADAVLACKEALADFDGSLVVLSGDCPLITSDTICRLVEMREQTNAAVVVLTMNLENPFGYGRIIRDSKGEVERIVEQKDATEEEAAVCECNSGFYCFDARMLFEALEQVDSNNAQGEFYLTDVLAISRAAGRLVCALPTEDAAECLGVNSRVQLAQATQQLQQRINAAHMLAGVTMVDPQAVWIGPHVQIAPDVELLPQTMLLGHTRIDENTVVGPCTTLVDTVVGKNCVLEAIVAHSARIADNITAEPFTEIKNSFFETAGQ